MRYLRDVRLERARELLLENGARSGDVGMQVGFESPAHFTREFKRRYGAPPSHYLRAARPSAESHTAVSTAQRELGVPGRRIR